MDDTKSLLKIVMDKVFWDNPHVVDDTYKIIYYYNGGKRKKADYEKTLKNICDIINNKLPPPILVYLLTLVDLPLDLEDGCQLPIIEKMQKSYKYVTESVRPQMITFLKSSKKPIVSPVETVKSNNTEIEESAFKMKSNMDSSNCVIEKKSAIRRRTRKRAGKNLTAENTEESSVQVKPLLDITANCVIKNEIRLKIMYTKKFEKAWEIINSNDYTGKSLQLCYNVVRDLNKKRKLLREIENDDITEELIQDAYQDTDIFLKEKHVYHTITNINPFDAIRKKHP